MLPVGAVLVDFDGTACLHDVAEHLLIEFGDPSYAEYDDAWEDGEITGRDAILAQDRMLHADHDALIRFVLAHCIMDPTFAPFCGWLRQMNIPVTLVSDGFGFYIRPMLRANGLDHIGVITNEQVWGGDRRPAGMRFVSGHPECVGCGTCKMRAVVRAREQHGPVAFVGEGASDRFGALYADVVFAKLDLPSYCRADGVPYIDWTDFNDIRRSLETLRETPGPVAPDRCPGWTVP